MRYFMHICDGKGFVEEEGRDLADDSEARKEAIAAARDVMAGDLRNGIVDLGSFIEVEDEAHKWLFTVTFADAVTVNAATDPDNIRAISESSRPKPDP